MPMLLHTLGLFNIAEVFIWGAGVFVLVLLFFSVYALWNRLSRKEIVRGLPRDDRW